MEVVYNPPLNMEPICICISKQFGFSVCPRVDRFLWVTWLLWFNSKNASLYSLHYTWFCLVKSMLPSHLSCHKLFKGCLFQKNNSSVTLPIHKVSHVWVSFITLNQILFHVSCHWWGNHHGPPLTSLFLSTSTHHLGIRPRNLVKYL